MAFWWCPGILLCHAGEENFLYDVELDFSLFTGNKKCAHNSH